MAVPHDGYDITSARLRQKCVSTGTVLMMLPMMMSALAGIPSPPPEAHTVCFLASRFKPDHFFELVQSPRL